ncbi:hypothetical protein CXB51_005200 [Gossypium anomalum]|uniref:Uncharacterized protein n=1 Tax=Gossypium anomalum TaxID=47600 RepID=A0A8J5ZF90_9ROSI|nr:hypothetical protein CXB51_005200 [Gossypium anomalum]
MRQPYNYNHQFHQSQRSAFATLFLLLLPIFFPNLFAPLRRTSPSLFSEWNAPKLRHLSLLEVALRWKTLIKQHFDLWSPLPNQG